MRFFLLPVVLLAASAFATDFPDRHHKAVHGILADSGIRGPSYARIVEEMENVARTHSAVATVHVYGRSVQDRPLVLVKLARADATGALPAVYIGGSIHGNEYLNIEDRLPRRFAEEAGKEGPIARYLAAGGAIYVAPILNPDGYDRRRRENHRGVDLNRDYTVREANITGFRQPETRALVNFLTEDLLRANRRLAIAVDYHCCIGALLYPWSFTGPAMPSGDLARHLNIANIMQRHLPQIAHGTTPTILGYSARGTSKDFYYEHFGALGFTYEGRHGEENHYFEDHAAMWTEIVAGLLP